MKKTYYYSLLQYSPSLALAEKINVGILYIFVEEQRLVLDTPAYLQRVKDTFPNIDLHYFKTSLKQHSQLAHDFNFGLFPPAQPQNIIYQVYGQPNSSSLQFTECQVGFYHQINDLIEKNRNLYFQSYKPNHSPAHDTQIINQLELYFNQLHIDKKLLNSQKVQIDEVKFNYSWKNGRTNFIQSVSFDYERQGYIKKRADEWMNWHFSPHIFQSKPRYYHW